MKHKKMIKAIHNAKLDRETKNLKIDFIVVSKEYFELLLEFYIHPDSKKKEGLYTIFGMQIYCSSSLSDEQFRIG